MHALKVGILTVSIVLLCIILLLILINFVFRIIYFDFFKDAERGFKIPGLNSGFVPQGIEQTEKGILMSGYMKNKSASRIYITDGKTSTHVEIFEADGTPHTGHGGGIDTYGDRVFLTGDGDIKLLALSDITDGDGKAAIIGAFDPGLGAAWCTVRSGYILVGSFASESIDAYPPKSTEVFTTPAGERNVALVKGYKLDESFPLGIDPSPKFAISIGEKIQGLSFADDGTIILSSSYGLASSRLTFHSVSKMTELSGEYKTDSEETIPLFYLDSRSELRSVKAPPMAEELMVKDGYVYIMNEAASNKYIFGKLIDQYRIWRYKI